MSCYKRAVRRWGLIAFLVVVTLGGSVTAARSSDRARGKSFHIQSRVRIDLTGTNAVDWTLAPGSSCSATGSGSQQIQVTSSGPASYHTLKLGLSVHRGKVANVTFSVPIYGGSEFRVSQRDDREGSITGDPASGDCDGLIGPDFVLGGPGSLCGTVKGATLMNFTPHIDVAKDAYVVRNGGLELGFTEDPGGGVGDVYSNDPNAQEPDCPLAGESPWLPTVLNGHAYNGASQDSFLLKSYDQEADAFEAVPSYARFSLKKLESCRAKTITAHTSAHDMSSGAFGINAGAGPPPADWAGWNATTTLQWKMTLHRVGRCSKKRE